MSGFSIGIMDPGLSKPFLAKGTNPNLATIDYSVQPFPPNRPPIAQRRKVVGMPRARAA
jgi:hypothetical protein